MFTRRIGAAAAAVVALALCLATPVLAQEASNLEVVRVDGRDVSLLMTLDPKVAIPTDAAVSGAMSVSGVVFPAQTNLNVKDTRPRAAMLVLDASGSMQGQRLAAAKEAARTFIGTLPQDVEIGLIAFNDSVRILQEPTLDRKALLAALDGVAATGETKLYDAISIGLQSAVNLDRARIVVLSDGADTSSKAQLTQVVKVVADAGIPVDIVGIQPGTEQAAILRQLTGASDGRLLTANGAADLGGAFVEATKAFGVQVGLTGTVPEGLDASGQVITATVSVDGRVSEQSATLPVLDSLTGVTGASTAGAVAVGPTSSTPGWWRVLWPILAGLIVGASLLFLAWALQRQRDRRQAVIRIRQVFSYRVGGRPSTANEPELDDDSGLIGSLDRFISRFRWYDGLRRSLAASELSLSPAAWLLIQLGVSTVLVVVLNAAFSSFVLGLGLGLGLGLFGTWAWVRSRAHARQKRFADELPDFLLLIASSLRAGLSFTHALESSAADGTGEVSIQLRRVVREVQVGADLDQALVDCADRMANDDLRWVVTALSIQREVGGSLSDILENAAQTIKARYSLHREIRTLSAEGRLSAYILIGLPIALFVFLLLLRREYISLMWTDAVGILMLIVLAVLMTVGIIWMRAVVKIKV